MTWARERWAGFNPNIRVRDAGRITMRTLVVGLALVFILWPYGLMIYQAVNDSVSFPAPFGGLTLRWLEGLTEYEPFRSALRISLTVGVAATFLALGIGLPGALAIARGPARLRSGWLAAFLATPIVVPEIVMSIAILQAVSVVGIDLGVPSLILAHGVLISPFILRTIAPAAAQISPAFEQVARTLGASWFRILRTITLPLLRPAITAAALVAFILSFINLPLALFLSSAREKTLPVEVYNYMTSRIDPLVAALGAVIMGVSLAVAVIVDRLLKVRIF